MTPPVSSPFAAADALAPLRGTRVVEFCHVAAGPYCGMLLADFGAEVVKVEPPDGDAMRQWPPLSGDGGGSGYSENFASINRGKRSAVVDLKDPVGRDFARRLALDADVVVENNRPGAMDRLGLGRDWFAARKPSLVYCSISAFGQGGPRRGEGGFDLTIQAAAGVMSVTGEPDGAPVKSGVPIVDFAAGLYAAFGIAALLSRVRAGGAGGHLDVPMFATTIAISALQTSEYFGTGRNPGKLGSAHPRNAPYQAFRGSDGWFVVAAGNQKLWLQVCALVPAPELPGDPRFATTTLRARHQAELKALLEPRFQERPIAHWLQAFAAAGVPCAPINGYAEALADPQSVATGLVQPMTLPNGHATRTVACPVRIDGHAVPVDTRAPALGADTDAVRAELDRRAPADTAASAPSTAPAAALDPLQPLRRFVQRLTACADRGADEAAFLAEGRVALAELIADDAWLPAACAAGSADTYLQHLLHCDPLERFSVTSFVWGPGQQTPVHDHTVWGLVGVLRGAERCEHFAVGADGVPRSTGASHVLKAGAIDAVSPTLGDWHRVSNAVPDRDSISIHVYGANIGAVRRHRLDTASGAVCDFVSGYSTATTPNLWDRSAAVRAQASGERRA